MSNATIRVPEIVPEPPVWTGGFGVDRFGIFAELVLGTVVQRLRWIPPGEFMMGSPKDELGRFKDEDPRHPVELSRGFWIGDTPVTQEFYEAVIGENRSEFQEETP